MEKTNDKLDGKRFKLIFLDGNEYKDDVEARAFNRHAFGSVTAFVANMGTG